MDRASTVETAAPANAWSSAARWGWISSQSRRHGGEVRSPGRKLSAGASKTSTPVQRSRNFAPDHFSMRPEAGSITLARWADQSISTT